MAGQPVETQENFLEPGGDRAGQTSMITFLPYPDFHESAGVLDWTHVRNRLSNQVDEGLEILDILLKNRKATHPVVKMWRLHEMALWEYTSECLVTWMEKKGLKKDPREDFVFKKLVVEVANGCPWSYEVKTLKTIYPSWLGNEQLHSNHRSILLGKLPSWYSQFGWKEQPATKDSRGRWGYVWFFA